MERSSRFISLSGWSGVSAGICGLGGAVAAWYKINHQGYDQNLRTELILIALMVFLAALISAVAFTYFKSRRDQVAIWGLAARRLLWNTMLPMLAGGIFLAKLIDLELWDLLAASSLIFYGLALVNGSRYTVGDIRYLGYAEMILGFIALWYPSAGLYLWALGFGLFHIIYGIIMWTKKDGNSA